MNKRRQKSSGQALVMVTMGLVAMAGLMGLAVDMGWSFFVQKQAQAVADAAALAAVQEAMAQVSAAWCDGRDYRALLALTLPRRRQAECLGSRRRRGARRRPICKLAASTRSNRQWLMIHHHLLRAERDMR